MGGGGKPLALGYGDDTGTAWATGSVCCAGGEKLLDTGGVCGSGGGEKLSAIGCGIDFGSGGKDFGALNAGLLIFVDNSDDGM